MSIQDTQKVASGGTSSTAGRLDRSALELQRQLRYVKKHVYADLFAEVPARRLLLSAEDSETNRHERLYVINKIKALLKDARYPAGVKHGELVADLLDGILAFGPIAEFMVDDEVTEIMVNHPDQVFVERRGKLVYTNVRFISTAHLLTHIERILLPLGKVVNERHPMVDSRLPDGSRVNVIVPPLAVQGPMLTIRKFVRPIVAAEDLIQLGSMSPNMSRFLQVAVETKRNIVICGGTATGKTTLLNVLSSFIPADERIITIEDAAELQLFQFHVGRLEARPPDLNGEGAVSIGDLFRNSLRMRPDRIIVGECRGPEALDMLQAMNSGHDGSITTAHANSTKDALSRLETMAMMAGSGLDSRSIRKQIASAVDVIVSLSRYADGSRKINMISELTGMEGETITRLDLFRFRQTGVAEDGRVLGVFEGNGTIPRFYDELRAQGISPPMDIFS
jgi:pilus assembly protein CpaF